MILWRLSYKQFKETRRLLVSRANDAILSQLCEKPPIVWRSSRVTNVNQQCETVLLMYNFAFSDAV